MLRFAPATAQTRTTHIYVVDVEGGALFVSPSGESVLIDTGNCTRGGDSRRRAHKDARLTQIDHLITTHWHSDHFGGMAEVAKRIPIREYIEQGANIQPAPASDEFFAKTYPALYGAPKHPIAKPGRHRCGRGARLAHRERGRGCTAGGGGAANASCATFNHKTPIRVPEHLIATIDLFVVSHSRARSFEFSRAGARHLPRVAIANNGTRKGAVPASMKTLFSSPSIEDVSQIHFSQLSGQENTVPGMFIANSIDEPQTAMPCRSSRSLHCRPGRRRRTTDPGYWIKVSAQQDGAFIVTNACNGFAKTYGAVGLGTN